MDLLYANDKLGQYPKSYWASVATPLAPFPPLQGEVQADICVVGAGFTGLSAALHLAGAGYKVVVLEAQRVGFGASGRNGGQVGSGQRVEQDDLEKMVGEDKARALWGLGEASKACVRGLMAKHSIACDWRDGILHAELKPKQLHHSIAYAEMLQTRYGYDDISALDSTKIRGHIGSEAYCGGTLDKGAGHLNPQKYVLGLARAAQKAGVEIYEGSKALSFSKAAKPVVSTAQGRVTADFLVLAGNGYMGGLSKKVARRVMPINNFIVATEPLGHALAKSLIRDDVAVADSKFVVNYFKRSADNRMVFGGGESYGYRFPKNIAAKAQKPMLEIFPQLAGAKIDYAWGGTLAITMNRMPNFARLAPNILSASGYSGHGVAMASLAGEILAETIQGTAERFDLFGATTPPRFPGGPALKTPLLALAMSYYALRDRI
ncbi:MAG TPA: FAD-binding oxidoreductase [Rhodobacteraceae bacterium]|nr:FAD-binding oxidoreductase [Paracoccaceae bacterium]